MKCWTVTKCLSYSSTDAEMIQCQADIFLVKHVTEHQHGGLRSYPPFQAFQLCSPSHGVVYSFATHMEWYHWRYCALLPITAKWDTNQCMTAIQTQSLLLFLLFLSVNRRCLHLCFTTWLHLHCRSCTTKPLSFTSFTTGRCFTEDEPIMKISLEKLLRSFSSQVPIFALSFDLWDVELVKKCETSVPEPCAAAHAVGCQR